MNIKDLYTDSIPINIGTGLINCYQGLILYTNKELRVTKIRIPEDTMLIVEGCYMSNQGTTLCCRYEKLLVEIDPLNLDYK